MIFQFSNGSDEYKSLIDKLHPNTAESKMLTKTVNFKIDRLKGTSLPVLK